MSETTNRSGGRWVLLLGLAFVLSLALAILLIRQSPGQAYPPAVAVSSLDLGTGIPARQAYARAVEVARNWQADAELALVSAYWRARQGGWSGSGWAFQFFSPASGRLAIVLVEPQEARLLRESPCPYPMLTFTADAWQVDSPAAVQTWLAQGGSQFLARPEEVDLALTLRVESAGEPPVWTITGVGGDQVWTVQVDGTSGEYREPE
jgi:hypothetical protein